MKNIKFLLSTAVLISATVMSVTLNAQVVTGVTSAPATSRTEPINVGGPTAEFYTKLDDGHYECLYQYRINTTDKAGNDVSEDYYCMLQCGPEVARFVDYSTFQTDSAALRVPAGEKPGLKAALPKNSGYTFTGDIIFGLPAGNLTYTDIITPDYMEYTEPLGAFDWQLTEQTDTVCGYLCQVAEAEYGGRKWTAWFADEIPMPFGPWKFNGLPGLILRVRDAEGIHDFSAISFKKGDVAIAKPHNKLLAHTTRGKFVANKIKFEKKPFDYIPTEAITDVQVMPGGKVSVNGVPVPTRPNGYTPIELE